MFNVFLSFFLQQELHRVQTERFRIEQNIIKERIFQVAREHFIQQIY